MKNVTSQTKAKADLWQMEVW